jgi:hypothetical protein
VVGALRGAPPRLRDQLAERGVAGLGFRQQHHLQPVVERELGADDQRQAGGARGFQRAHDAGQRALVGDRQRSVAVARGALEQARSRWTRRGRS